MGAVALDRGGICEVGSPVRGETPLGVGAGFTPDGSEEVPSPGETTPGTRLVSVMPRPVSAGLGDEVRPVGVSTPPFAGAASAGVVALPGTAPAAVVGLVAEVAAPAPFALVVLAVPAVPPAEAEALVPPAVPLPLLPAEPALPAAAPPPAPLPPPPAPCANVPDTHVALHKPAARSKILVFMGRNRGALPRGFSGREPLWLAIRATDRRVGPLFEAPWAKLSRLAPRERLCGHCTAT
jgi:hypothetical protein